MEGCVFIVWNMHADAWPEGRTVTSIHKTLEGAEDTIPNHLTKLKRPGRGDYILDYTYFAIELYTLED